MSEKLRQVKVGDFVRSFDFESRDVEGDRACYCEGVVEDVVQGPDCDRYKICVTRRVFGGKVLTGDRVEKEVFPPVNGTPKSFGGVCDGVENVAFVAGVGHTRCGIYSGNPSRTQT